jgi:hypothetical protein
MTVNKLLTCSAALLVAVSPAAAKPGQHGHSQAAMPPSSNAAQVHGSQARLNARGQLDMNGNGLPDWREQRLIDANGNGIADWRESRRVDINGNGIPDWRERLIDANHNGIDDRQEAMIGRYGGAQCPPGLAKKTPACIPPGQVGRSYSIGQHVPTGFVYTPYGSIPVPIQQQYNLDPNYRYIYNNNTLYVVDPVTRVVRNVINSVIF